MKLYIVSWLDTENKGQLTPFTSRQKAMGYLKTLDEPGVANMVDGIHEEDFPLSAAGVVQALQYGAEKVWK